MWQVMTSIVYKWEKLSFSLQVIEVVGDRDVTWLWVSLVCSQTQGLCLSFFFPLFNFQKICPKYPLKLRGTQVWEASRRGV